MTSPVTWQQMRHVVEAASLAPSIHNTQPWSFVSQHSRLQLRADRSRRLTVLDPDGRQLYLSCGTALQTALVAARALSLDASVELLPDRDDPDQLAVLTLGQGAPASEDEVELATAILRRHTYRGTFRDESLPGALLERLRLDAHEHGVAVRAVDREDELVALAALLDRADRLEERDEAYRSELRRWVHTEVDRLDGIPADHVVSAPGSSLRQRDFTCAHPAGGDGSTPRADHPTVIVLGTDDDTPMSWLKAGQALGAILLRAAAYDVQAQPLGQVTDMLGSRRRLRHFLGVVTTPQLVLRMGHGTHVPATPRRSVEEILTRG